MKIFVLAILATLCLSAAASAQKLGGVWRLTEVRTTGTNGTTKQVTQPSMYLFTKSHYSIIYVSSDAPRDTADADTMTADQLRKVFVESFIANAGTYEMKAGKLTVTPLVAKSPGYMQAGTWSRYAVKISGNMMTLTTEASNSGPSANPTTFTLTRVE